jgi:hypothetical protein
MLDPAVIASIVPNPACLGTSQTFTAQAATGGVPPYTYEWDFEDDATFDAAGLTATNIYAAAGPYTVRLRVTDSCTSPGPQTQETTDVVTVNPLPVITETCGSPTPAESTLDAGAGYVAYLWNTTPPGGPKDGAKSQTISVPCGTVETYTVTVQDGNGCFGTSAPPYMVCLCDGSPPEPYPVTAGDAKGNTWTVGNHDPATTQYYVYYNPLTSFGQPLADDKYDNGATVANDCIAGWADNLDGTATITPSVALDNSWLLLTAATDTPGSESTVGVDSAGTERSTVGTWTPMCGP